VELGAGMNIKKITLLVFPGLILAGCSWLNPGLKGGAGGRWEKLEPPQEDALGHTYRKAGEIVDLGDMAYFSLDGRVVSSKSTDEVIKAEHENFQASLNATARMAAARVKLEYVSSEKVDSSEWVVRSINKPYEGAKVNEWIMYKCLTAKSYTFEVKDKFGMGAGANVSSELADEVGVDAVELNVSNVPDSPGLYKVRIENPDICLAYRGVMFSTVGRDKQKAITNGSGKTSFTLDPGESSDFRTPELDGYGGSDVPEFLLRAGNVEKKNQDPEEADLSNLEVCMKDKSFIHVPKSKQSVPYSCISLYKTSGSSWRDRYSAGIFNYDKDRLALIKVDVNAEDMGQGRVKINKASLVSLLIKKQYEP